MWNLLWGRRSLQYEDPDYEGGANHISLRDAQKNYKEFGACEKRCLEYVREPNKIDIYGGPLDISNICRMDIKEMIKIFKAADAPLEKILDLYNGNIRVENSNFIFNREQLEEFLPYEDMNEYFYLSKKDELRNRLFTPNEEINNLLNSRDDEAEEKMKIIQRKFIEAIGKI